MFVLILFLGYKGANYIYYTKISSNLKNHLAINDTITINLKETNKEYLEFKNIKIRNDFKDFELLDFGNNDVKKYILKKNNETFAAFVFGTFNIVPVIIKFGYFKNAIISNINMLNVDIDDLWGEDEYDWLNDNFENTI